MKLDALIPKDEPVIRRLMREMVDFQRDLIFQPLKEARFLNPLLHIFAFIRDRMQASLELHLSDEQTNRNSHCRFGPWGDGYSSGANRSKIVPPC